MNGEDGYTIIEALAAMSILAVSLVTFYAVGSDILVAADRVSTSNRAALFAQSKLDTLAIRPTPLPAKDGGYDKDLSWTIISRDVSSSGPWNPLVLQDVELTVLWRDGSYGRSLTFTTRHLGTRER